VRDLVHAVTIQDRWYFNLEQIYFRALNRQIVASLGLSIAMYNFCVLLLTITIGLRNIKLHESTNPSIRDASVLICSRKMLKTRIVTSLPFGQLRTLRLLRRYHTTVLENQP
jgi:hypothetical protein